MKEIHRLHNSFKLPEECKMLSDSLQEWREEVEALSSSRSAKPTAERRLDVGRNARNPASQPSSSSQTKLRSQRKGSVRIVGAKGALVDPQTWIDFSDSSQSLVFRLNSLAYAMYYVSELQHPRCTEAIRQLVRTLSVRNILDVVCLLISRNDEGNYYDYSQRNTIAWCFFTPIVRQCPYLRMMFYFQKISQSHLSRAGTSGILCTVV